MNSENILNVAVTAINDGVPLSFAGRITQPHVICPKHGTHPNIITSTIPGYHGTWCQLCWIELLGPPLPTEVLPYEIK